MTELNFSKKQIGPLVAKYGIDVENDERFKKLINLFDNQTNYQMWAIKLLYTGVANLDTITSIAEWIEGHKSDIQKLSKKNVILYNSRSGLAMLRKEIKGLNVLAMVKSSVNKFNTAQRKMLTDLLLSRELSPLEAGNDKTLLEWYNTFIQIAQLPHHRQEKLIVSASALTDLKALIELIMSVLDASYTWDKEDMLSFVKRNCKDCEVIYDQGPIVILTIGSFASSEKLCGKGRTSWCLTREKRYFDQYVTEAKANQYFFFDFSKKENHPLAHVGFTVRGGEGITNAHSSTNVSMLGSGCPVDGVNVTIQNLLKMHDIKSSIFVRLRPLKSYEWNKASFKSYISKNKAMANIVYENDDIIVVRSNNASYAATIIPHSLINPSQMPTNDYNETFIVLNFGMDVNSEKSIIALQYEKDQFNCFKLSKARDVYNNPVNLDGIYDYVGVKENNILKAQGISPEVQLHKYIFDGNEDAAIELIDSNPDIDVSYEFNGMIPIFEAVERHMSRLFEKILSQKNFKETCDALGETMLTNALYFYHVDGVTTPEEDERTKNIIDMLIDSETYDINVPNTNEDTPLSVACETPHTLWVVEKLLQKPNIKLDTVNDIGLTPLGNAISTKNTEAIKLLLAHKDLVVVESDLNEAKNQGINLNDFKKTSNSSPLTEVEDIFARAFAKFGK